MSRGNECMRPELNIFEPRPIQLSILKTEEIRLKPIASIENTDVIEFISYGHGDTYRDVSSIYFKFKVKFDYADAATKVLTAVKVSVINNILSSMIRQVSVFLNGKPIATNEGHQNYRCYIEHLINYSLESGDQFLDGSLFELDLPGQSDTIAAATNASFNARGLPFLLGNTVELVGRLSIDFFNQSKLLINGVDMKVLLYLEKPEFYMLADDADRTVIKILDANMYINHVTINPDLLLAHAKTLKVHNAVYPYKKIEVRPFTLNPQSNSFSIDNLITGILPEIVLFCMVDSDSFIGKRSKSPYNFQHYKIESFNLFVNGFQAQSEPYQFDYTKTGYYNSSHGYHAFARGVNLHRFDRGHQISKAYFDDGCFLICYDISADKTGDMFCINLPEQGTLRVEAKFSEPIKKSIVLLMYAQFDSEIIIDEQRNVFAQVH